MLQLSMPEVVAATAADVLVGGGGRVTGVVIDSRQVQQGSLFVCFSGERVDGNAYAPSAIERGAAAIALTAKPDDSLVQMAQDRGCTLLRAADDDPTEFVLRLASAWRKRNPQWVLVGVTGSVGKTTTKDMLAAGLSAGGKVHATSGNHNNLIGMSMTLLSADASDEFVVCEMGMDHAGELTRLAAVARPDLAVITNVGTSHIGNLGSREAIARAKAEICSGMRASDDARASVPSRLIMTSDNDFGTLIESEYAAPAGIKVMRVGMTEECAVRARSVTLDDEGMPTVSIAFADGCELFVTLDVPGTHVVPDFLLAMAVVWRLGVDRANACSAPCSARAAASPFSARLASWGRTRRACMATWVPTRPQSHSTSWPSWAARMPTAWPRPRSPWASRKTSSSALQTARRRSRRCAASLEKMT